MSASAATPIAMSAAAAAASDAASSNATAGRKRGAKSAGKSRSASTSGGRSKSSGKGKKAGSASSTGGKRKSSGAKESASKRQKTGAGTTHKARSKSAGKGAAKKSKGANAAAAAAGAVDVAMTAAPAAPATTAAADLTAPEHAMVDAVVAKVIAGAQNASKKKKKSNKVALDDKDQWNWGYGGANHHDGQIATQPLRRMIRQILAANGSQSQYRIRVGEEVTQMLRRVVEEKVSRLLKAGQLNTFSAGRQTTSDTDIRTAQNVCKVMEGADPSGLIVTPVRRAPKDEETKAKHEQKQREREAKLDERDRKKEQSEIKKQQKREKEREERLAKKKAADAQKLLDYEASVAAAKANGLPIPAAPTAGKRRGGSKPRKAVPAATGSGGALAGMALHQPQLVDVAA